MSHRVQRRRVVSAVCLAAFACAGAGAAVAQVGGAAPGAGFVALLAPGGSRLGEELKQELELSRFSVVVVAVPGSATTGDRVAAQTAHDLLSVSVSHAVVVSADERHIRVVSRAPGRNAIETNFDVRLNAIDHPTRRRACLTVVEHLRVRTPHPSPLPAGRGEGEGTARNDGEILAGRRTPDTAGRGTPDTAGRGRNARNDGEILAGRRTPDTAGRGRNARNDGEILAERRTLDSTGTTTVVEGVAFDDGRPRAIPRTMGVATVLDVSATRSQPTGHLNFMWYFPLGPRLTVHTRAFWPIVGHGFRDDAIDVRMWTFGAALGLQYGFAELPAPTRPFVGLSVGNTMLLTDSSSGAPLQSRSAVTPSATVGVSGGLRYALGSRAQLLWELEVRRGFLLATTNRAIYETAAAKAVSLHGSFGVLFEY